MRNERKKFIEFIDTKNNIDKSYPDATLIRTYHNLFCLLKGKSYNSNFFRVQRMNMVPKL